MEVIAKPGGVNDLKKSILRKYVKFIKSQMDIDKNLLADKKWAFSNTEYHKQCRKETADEIKNIEKQLKLLKAFHE